MKKSIIKQSFINGGLVFVVYGLLYNSSIIWYSLACGWFIGLILNYFYVFIGIKNKVMSSDKVLSQIRKALIIKFMLNLIAFAFIIIFFRQLNFIALFVSYLATLSAYWFILIKQ